MSTPDRSHEGDEHDHEGPVETIGDLEVRRISGDVQHHADLSTRSKARKQALDILFEADAMGTDPLEVLALRPTVVENPVRPFAADLVRGVVASRPRLEAAVEECLAPGWSLARMPRVDRVLALIGAHEILETETPRGAVISEAVELSEEFSTDDSATFLNGLLNAVADRAEASATRTDGAVAAGSTDTTYGGGDSEATDLHEQVTQDGVSD